MIDLQSIPKNQKKESLILGNHTCVNNNPAYRICTNKNCLHPSLCCQDQDCECNQLHSICTQIRLKSLLQKLYSKTADTTEIISKVTNLFDSIIDQVSQIYQQTQKRIKRYGLRHAQIKFIEYLEQNRSHTLTGKIVHDASQIADIKYDGDFWQIQTVVDKLWNQLGGLFWGMLYATKDMYEIPTRVNRLNDDSGEEFFADVVEQTKAILTALQDMNEEKEQEEEKKQQVGFRNWGLTKAPAESKVLIKKQKQRNQKGEIKYEDLGYSDDQFIQVEQKPQQDAIKQVKVQQNQRQKAQKVIKKLRQQMYVNNKVQTQKSQIKKLPISKQPKQKEQRQSFISLKRQQQLKQKQAAQINRMNNPFLDILTEKDKQKIKKQEPKHIEEQIVISKSQNYKNLPVLVNKQLKSDEQMMKISEDIEQRFNFDKVVIQQPVFDQIEKSQVKGSINIKVVEDENKVQSQAKYSLFGAINKPKIVVQDDKLFNEACEYLNENLGLGSKVCKQFVEKNGYNSEGKLFTMEQILDIALTSGDFFN